MGFDLNAFIPYDKANKKKKAENKTNIIIKCRATLGLKYGLEVENSINEPKNNPKFDRWKL